MLHYAIAREVEANVFYNLLSQYVDNERVRKFCNDLAAEELEHKGRLEFELMKLGVVVRPSDVSEVKTQLGTVKPLDYMLEMAKIMQLDLMQVVNLAMEKEKKSFRLYLDLMLMVPDEACRNVLAELAEEEARHKLIFELEYESLKVQQKEPPITD